MLIHEPPPIKTGAAETRAYSLAHKLAQFCEYSEWNFAYLTPTGYNPKTLTGKAKLNDLIGSTMKQ